MNLTLDLNDAEIYIPTGKLMNLKSKEKWKEISETKFIVNDMDVAAHDFKLKEYTVKVELGEQKSHYKTLLQNIVAKKDMKEAAQKISAPIMLEHIFSDIIEAVAAKDSVKEKMAKLNKLRQINETMGG